MGSPLTETPVPRGAGLVRPGARRPRRVEKRYPVPMILLDRMALIVRPKRRFVDWVNGLGTATPGTFYLAGDRLAVSRVREISNASDFFALLLLLALFHRGMTRKRGLNESAPSPFPAYQRPCESFRPRRSLYTRVEETDTPRWSRRERG